MGLKKQLNSEYNSRYKTFAVHRPVTIKAKVLSHPSDVAPEVLDSSRRAGLLSNQFLNVSEPALQRKRIVPYKRNHNILSTSTVKELNDREWIEAVGNEEGEIISAGNVEKKNVKKTENTEYSSSFAEQRVEKDSPIILASKAKMKHKARDHSTQIKRSASTQKQHKEKSPERMPPAGIPTYIADPQDKRLLRPSDDLMYPVTSQKQIRNSQTEYSERYINSAPAGRRETPAPKSEETSNIDMATFKKVLLHRNDAYGLSSTSKASSPAKQQSSRKTTTPKHSKRNSARRASLESRNSGSYISQSKKNDLAKTYAVDKNKPKYEKRMPRTFQHISSRSLDNDNLSSVHSSSREEATRKSKKKLDKVTNGSKFHERRTNDVYGESASSCGSYSMNNETKHKKDKLFAMEVRAKNAKHPYTRRDLEEESVSSIISARSLEDNTRKRNEKLKTEKPSNSFKTERTNAGRQAWEDKPLAKDKTQGSRRISRDRFRGFGISDRGRSPTPEMRTAGQSRRHHLDITTGSSNPLATGPDPRQVVGNMKYGRAVYDPSRYSDVGESLTSSRSFAT